METTDNNNALVSIIIPAYNTEQYIHRAIESSIRQTYKNIEIIIIDDGSTDGTLGVAQSYEPKDSRVKVIHQENKGVSSARNHGIREAKGEFITFLDSDDWFEDNAVEVLVEAQLKYPDKFISTNLYYVIFDTKNNSFIRTYHRNIVTETKIFSITETLEAIYDIQFFFIPAKLSISAILKKNNIYFMENIHYAEDIVFNFDYLTKSSGLFYIDKPVVNVLKRPDSAMNVSYDKRRIFVNGKLNDHVQIMIDRPGNTDEVKRLLKIHHVMRFLRELIIVILRHGSRDKMNQVIERLRLYLPEYIKFNHDMPLTRKIYYYCILYLPLPIARTLCKIRVHMRDIISRIRRRFSKPKEEGEVIPYW